MEPEDPSEPPQTVEDTIASWSSDPPAESDQLESDARSDADHSESSAPDQSADSSTDDEDSAYSWLDSNGDEQTSGDESRSTAPVEPSMPELATPEPTPDDTSATAELDEAIPLPTSNAPIETTADASSTDAGARAAELVEELRNLIPLLSTPAGAGDADVSGHVASQLAEVLEQNGEEAERFQSLRAAVATAQARPRDVDIMLDLVARADSIAAVISAHDRYVAAIESAVAELRGEKPPEPTPRW